MHVRAAGISKRFSGVQALLGVDLEIERGTIHALVGENGAGKSTLGKIIAGVHRPDAGELWIDGAGVCRFRSPADALACGITIVGQERALEPRRSIAENVYLGLEPGARGLIDRRRLRAACADVARSVGFEDLADDPNRLVTSLGAADRQKVEILRALVRKAELIVMDEPTASLPATDIEHLLHIAVSLRARGITVVYISHRLQEVMSISDRVTVLRDGRIVDTSDIADVTSDTIVTAMLGRSHDLAFPERHMALGDAPVVLDVRGLARPPAVNGVDFTIRAGEVVGLAGLIGSGRTEIARLIFGADRRTAGTVLLDGRPVTFRSPTEAIAQGIVLLPESRKEQGLLLARSVKENVTLPHLASFSRLGLLRAPLETARATEATTDLGVRTATIDTRVSALSGGNQQKVLFARSLLRSPRLLIVDEPTRGIDVGAKRSIYELLDRLAAAGMAVLLISSELEEIVGLSHRVLVVRSGRITAEFARGLIDEQAVLSAALAVS